MRFKSGSLTAAVMAIFVAAFAGSGVAFGEEKKAGSGDVKPAAAQQKDTQKKDGKMQEVAVLETRHGKIVFKFFPDSAPKHVESFKKLAKSGFYDGTTFHRVIPGFMIQGGDPNSKNANARHTHGTGGPGYNIKAEFSMISHKRGIVSMARAMDPDSAGSQFFICVADANFLDGQYTVFGEVIEGMDAADKIVNEKRDGNDNPLERVEMKVKIEEKAAK